MIYRPDRTNMQAHPEEADEAFAEGVKVKWMSTVKQFGNDEITVEEMEMLPDGSGTIGTGRYQTAEDRFAGARGRRARGRRVPEDAARRHASVAATWSRSTPG